MTTLGAPDLKLTKTSRAILSDFLKSSGSQEVQILYGSNTTRHCQKHENKNEVILLHTNEKVQILDWKYLPIVY